MQRQYLILIIVGVVGLIVIYFWANAASKAATSTTTATPSGSNGLTPATYGPSSSLYYGNQIAMAEGGTIIS